MPEAYCTGKVDFYGREFFVTPDVLIPRPETEAAIDAVLNLAGKAYLPGVKAGERKIPKKPVIIDVGTGSGCIAVTIKKELPEAEVIATDVSEKALEVAQKNADFYGTPISFIISHLCQKCKYHPDIVVANLPYVDKNWEWLDREALSYEPEVALYAEDGGLKLIKELINTVKTKYLILEADPCQHREIIEYAKIHSYKLEEIRGFVLVFKFTKK